MKAEASPSQFPSGPTETLDEGELSRLLALAGPGDARELMRRLISDLSTVKAGVTTALMTQDRSVMRQHSHVLLAIAGTIGATAIYELALRLNLCAKDETCTSALPQATEVLLRLEALTQNLQRLASDLGMAV